MKAIAPWLGAALGAPLIVFLMVRAFHRNPELFGLNVKPNNATAASSAIPPRDDLLRRATACQYSTDITRLDDKRLNDLVAKCEATKTK